MTIKVDDVSINRQFLETDDEEEACTLLFNTYHKAVFAKISGMMWDHLDPAVAAEDIVQETFIKAFKERKTLREQEKLRGWLLTIATNLTLNEIRNAERRRQAGNSPLGSLDNPSISESEAPFASFLAETDAEQTEANRYMARQCLRLLKREDLLLVKLMFADQLKPEQIAERIDSTADAVQKRWERIRKWLKPIAHNLNALVNCLPDDNDRNVMKRYLDGQPRSEIAQAMSISRSDLEETVKRVIKQWKKAAEENPTDPVSAMVKKER